MNNKNKIQNPNKKEGRTMKTMKTILIAAIILLAGFNNPLPANVEIFHENPEQPGFIPEIVDTPTASDYSSYRDDQGNTYITNNYYYDDDYYDYSYSARIRRFYHPVYSSYWHDYYTNYYWYTYDPVLFGVSIYYGYNWWYPGPWRGGWRIWWSWGWGWSWGWYGGYWGVYSYWGPSWYWPGYYGAFYYGWGNPWGWGYWNGYANGYWNGYWNGYYNGLYASYYNSYDPNSSTYYYGHRPNLPGGRQSVSNNSVVSGQSTNSTLKQASPVTRGETKANISNPAQVQTDRGTGKSNTINPNTPDVYTSPQVQQENAVRNYGGYTAPQAPKPVYIERPSSVSQPNNPVQNNSGYSRPQPVNPGHNRPQPANPNPGNYGRPNQTPSTPRNHYSAPDNSPSYQAPASRPRSYTQPQNFSRPRYNSSPSVSPGFSRPSSPGGFSRPGSGGFSSPSPAGRPSGGVRSMPSPGGRMGRPK